VGRGLLVGAAVLALAALVLVPSCSQVHPVAVSTSPHNPTPPRSVPTTLQAGQTLTTAAGLTLTVPRGVLSASLATSTPTNQLQWVDSVVVDGIHESDSSYVVFIFSSVAATAPLAGLDAFAHTTRAPFRLMTSGNGTSVYTGLMGDTKAPRRLFAVVGPGPRGKLAIVIVANSLPGTWRTLKIRGLKLPPGLAG
jgi:hypothetical protein